MQIIVRVLSGRYITLNVESDMDTNDLKNAIEDVEFLPAQYTRIKKDGLIIGGGMVGALFDNGDIIDIEMEVLSGMRAKWRKKRIRRLKRIRRRRRLRNR
jgi:small subunit ribosomal protein S27Ae